jgi:putative hydrolase of the HAD superfamily
MNRIMCHYINEHLERADQQAVYAVSEKITAFQADYLKRNRALLLGLSKKFKLGIISNFSGNLEVILKEFQMLDFFDFVLDSYHVGVTKPDQKIFKLAIEKCGVDPSEICYMGDNAIRDMIPAKKAGMNTIHILNLQESRIKTKECTPTATVESLMEIKSLVCPS